MAPLPIREEHEEVASFEIVPTSTRPLGPADIRKLEMDEASTLELEFGAGGAVIDGKPQAGKTKVKAKISFNSPIAIYALVQGGWLPLPFVIPRRFLVDRNVVITLRKIREGKDTANGQALQWWTQFFNGSDSIFNPLLHAFEAGYRRKPTMAEFVTAYDDAASELRKALPGCHIVKFEDAGYQAAYEQLEAFDKRNECEVRFLQAACPLVVQRVARREEAHVEAAIIQTAKEHNVNPASFASLAVLSCLYEDIHGTPTAIGRQILKPKPIYLKADAFNALSDLRHIEIAAAGQAYFKQEGFSLCTCDRGLALMWSALAVHGEFKSDKHLEFTFELTNDLFSRLNEMELQNLKNRLGA